MFPSSDVKYHSMGLPNIKIFIEDITSLAKTSKLKQSLNIFQLRKDINYLYLFKGWL